MARKRDQVIVVIMEFIVSEKIFEKFPDIKIGIIVVSDVDNKGENEGVAKLLGYSQNTIKEKFDLQTPAENPTIKKWRQIYSSFGSKPSDYRSSIESIIRSILSGRGVRHINKLVDMYNHISMKHIVPAGGEDIDMIEGNIHLKFSNGEEKFIPLGSGKEDNPYKGEVIYCDDGGNVLCRRWNWRESDKTKITEGTKNAIIVVEGFDSTVSDASEELSELIKKFCKAETRVFLADKNNPDIEW